MNKTKKIKDRNFSRVNLHETPKLRIVPYVGHGGFQKFQVQKRVFFFFWTPISRAFADVDDAGAFLEFYMENNEDCYNI
ncbi:hypothetical protein [Photobacterium kishitanii]|uniref:Uncharacterized protein n=1 Tax=Photobacterium kishitanii TaxID=318456 RepID=A0A2T3KLJ4_9GAMM|nr:hypothetical protein [Photobacterium kishitanii]PSV00539.1 hypothetical protein C9J27_05235 [Photobacterium kishitanii]